MLVRVRTYSSGVQVCRCCTYIYQVGFYLVSYHMYQVPGTSIIYYGDREAGRNREGWNRGRHNDLSFLS